VVDVLFDVVVLLMTLISQGLIFVACTRKFGVHRNKRELF